MIGKASRLALIACALVASPAHTQLATVSDSDEPPLASPPPADPCASVVPDEITVCAQRDQAEPYRIDPGVLGEQRAKTANPEPDRMGALKPEKCPPHGPRCSGQGAIPISAIALVAVKTAILVATNENWREPLGLADHSYDEYRAAKAREQRRRDERKVRFGILSGKR